MNDKYTSEYQPGDLTPSETREIWRRVREQFRHDNNQDAVLVEFGNDDYVMRQIAYYIDQVKSERGDND